MNSIIYKGQLKKMITESKSPIHYYLDLNDSYLNVNQLIGREIEIEHTHNECLNCSRDLEIFRMGYCKNCFFTVPQTNESVIRPELAKAHLGVEQRDLSWEQQFELQPHIVYLALTGGLKVGVTRAQQIPTRWIDQGAQQAIILAETENRFEAGVIEVALSKEIADKTNYQRMLKNQVPNLNLIEKKEELKEFVPTEMKKFISANNKIFELEFPIEEYPTKISSVKLSKENTFNGTLKGIKGQYLIFENNKVFNVRNHEGFYVNIKLN